MSKPLSEVLFSETRPYIIKARFTSNCTSCHTIMKVGSTILWKKREYAMHIECAAVNPITRDIVESLTRKGKIKQLRSGTPAIKVGKSSIRPVF